MESARDPLSIKKIYQIMTKSALSAVEAVLKSEPLKTIQI